MRYLQALLFSGLLLTGVHAMGQGIISTIAGNGVSQYIGDGWPGTSYSLATPNGLCIAGNGDVYECDYGLPRIRRVNKYDSLFTVAGIGTNGFAGDGGPATAATFGNPTGVAFDVAGNLYVCEEHNNRIRKISKATGLISTVCGSGGGGYGGDGGPALSADMEGPAGLSVDKLGNIYIADKGNCRIRMVDHSTGVISTIAGTGTCGYDGDGGAATSAKLSYPKSVYADTLGNLYIADFGNNRVRKVNLGTGTITTVAGTGTPALSGDGGPATSAALQQPNSVFLSKKGNLYISDFGNNVIRMVTPGGTIYTVAGSGMYGYSGDGGWATVATFLGPLAVCTDDSEYLYIADGGNSAIRKVTPGPLGVKNVVADNRVSVYPNPSAGIVYVHASIDGETSLIVYNTSGQVILVIPISSVNTELDLTSYPTGVYYISVRSAAGIQNEKVVVMH